MKAPQYLTNVLPELAEGDTVLCPICALPMDRDRLHFHRDAMTAAEKADYLEESAHTSDGIPWVDLRPYVWRMGKQ